MFSLNISIKCWKTKCAADLCYMNTLWNPMLMEASLTVVFFN